MRKIVSIAMLCVCILAAVAACGGKNDAKSADIAVVTREEGSGTRSAFVELFGIEVKGEDGTKKDMTTKEANTASKTDIMITNVASDENAIGYISLGSLTEKVKGLEIDDVKPTADNVKNGKYKIARPFVIASKGELSPIAQNFVDFIMSKQGQEVVGKSCTPVDDNAPEFAGILGEGSIVVSGSSSVNPVMEKLKEAYEALNAGATIEIQASDSTTGINNAIQGICDIAMSSRELKDNEKAELTPKTIAIDGIAVIVNTNNDINGLTSEQVKKIFTGEMKKWSEAQK